MSLEQAAAFALFAAVAAITPGPSNVMLTATGAVAGIVRGLPCLLGVASGMALLMFIAAVGLASLVLDFPRVLEALKWCGGAFLLWLAWKIARTPVAEAGSDAGAVGFLAAFAFQWLNPKSWLVALSASATFLRGDGGALAQALWIAALFFSIALACGFLWLAFGAAMRSLLRSHQTQRIFRVSMALLLASSVLLFVR